MLLGLIRNVRWSPPLSDIPTTGHLIIIPFAKPANMAIAEEDVEEPTMIYSSAEDMFIIAYVVEQDFLQ